MPQVVNSKLPELSSWTRSSTIKAVLQGLKRWVGAPAHATESARVTPAGHKRLPLSLAPGCFRAMMDKKSLKLAQPPDGANY